MFLFVLSNFAAFALRTLRAFVIVLFLLVLRIDSIPNRTGPKNGAGCSIRDSTLQKLPYPEHVVLYRPSSSPLPVGYRLHIYPVKFGARLRLTACKHTLRVPKGTIFNRVDPDWQAPGRPARHLDTLATDPRRPARTSSPSPPCGGPKKKKKAQGREQIEGDKSSDQTLYFVYRTRNSYP